MAIGELTVCDSDGKIETMKGALCPVSGNPYRFYAGVANGNSVTGSTKIEVQMVLPVGGDTSGLFRLPRVGERVLVEVGGAANINYLLGYVPSDWTPVWPQFEDNAQRTQEENKLLGTEKGMVLRYQQTGKKNPKKDEKYSEIGFYQQPTSWKAKDEKEYTAFENLKKDSSPASDTGDGINKFPKIDHINIQSAGDIHSKAQNHHQTMAKRFELLVDCDPPNHKKDLAEYTAKDYPLGDRPGDDPFLYTGDAHIRAANRIIIKAGTEIRLEVGRSSIIINDSGIILASRKIDSNIENSWDTIINMNHRSGLTMFGQHVKIDSGMDFAITEGFGSSIKSLAGIMRISAKDIMAKTLSTANYIVQGAAMGAEIAGNVSTMGAALGEADNKLSSLNSAGKYIRTGAQLVGGFVGERFDYQEIGGVDTTGTFAKLLSLLYSILKMTWTAIEMCIPLEKRKKGLDGFSFATSVVEYGLAMGAFVELAAKNLPAAFHSNLVHLGASADMAIINKDLFISNLGFNRVTSPLAGVDTANIKEVFKGGWKDFWGKKGAFILGGLVGAKTGGAIIGAVVFRDGGIKDQDKEYIAKLMMLKTGSDGSDQTKDLPDDLPPDSAPYNSDSPFDGNAGGTGKDGKSAYEIWLDAGNTGTEADFIASLKGDTGGQGERGEQGVQGEQGEQGVQGEQGEQGVQGEQGEQGERGETGAQGVQGEQGERGESGAQGVQGEQGATGATGATGTQGAQGSQGATGATGAAGAAGKDGSSNMAQGIFAGAATGGVAGAGLGAATGMMTGGKSLGGSPAGGDPFGSGAGGPAGSADSPTGGGSAGGGASSAGGSPAGGGASSAGGSPAVGGANSAGGSPAGGGASSAGGSPTGGGSGSAGGSPAGGGANSEGGSPAGGGASSTGGSPAGGAGSPVGGGSAGSGNTAGESAAGVANAGAGLAGIAGAPGKGAAAGKTGPGGKTGGFFDRGGVSSARHTGIGGLSGGSSAGISGRSSGMGGLADGGVPAGDVPAKTGKPSWWRRLLEWLRGQTPNS